MHTTKRLSLVQAMSVIHQDLKVKTKVRNSIKRLPVVSMQVYSGPVQMPLHSCAEPNWWIKYGKRAASESIWCGKSVKFDRVCRTFVELNLGSTHGTPSESDVAAVSLQSWTHSVRFGVRHMKSTAPEPGLSRGVNSSTYLVYRTKNVHSKCFFLVTSKLYLKLKLNFCAILLLAFVSKRPVCASRPQTECFTVSVQVSFKA